MEDMHAETTKPIRGEHSAKEKKTFGGRSEKGEKRRIVAHS